MRRIPLLSLLGSLGLLLAACAGRTVSTEPMVYYPAAHVYVMHSYPSVYYHEGYRGSYYRVHEDGWQRAPSPVGPWRPIKKHRLPPGLRKKSAATQ
jgi:hypothetical protein